MAKRIYTKKWDNGHIFSYEDSGSAVKKIINLDTLDIYPSASFCAYSLGVSPACITSGIQRGIKVKNQRLEYYDFFNELTAADKEKLMERHNVYFMGL